MVLWMRLQVNADQVGFLEAKRRPHRQPPAAGRRLPVYIDPDRPRDEIQFRDPGPRGRVVGLIVDL